MLWMGARIRLGRRNSANVQDARPSASAQPSTLSTQWMPILASRGGVPLKWRAHRLCSPNSAGLFVAGDASHSWQAQMHPGWHMYWIRVNHIFAPSDV